MKAKMLLAVLLYTAVGAAQHGQEWPIYGGDAGGMRYSPLVQVSRANVRNLQVAWRWRTGEVPIREKGATPGKFEATPLMIGDVLYVSTPYNRVVALDAVSGHELWSYDPRAYDGGQPLRPTGFVHRGLAAWSDGHGRRIFLACRGRLIALDAANGAPIADFGKGGEIDLLADLAWKVNPRHNENTSPPVVYKNLVIVGNSVADGLIYQHAPPGDVQAFDVHTGKRVWRFRTVPPPGELGNTTWEDRSWQVSGHANVWAPMVVDDRRGLLYLPVSTGQNDYYGGQRKGDNLFADSLVCLDATTGRRVWHFQTVHHALWDYDGVMAPTLGTIEADGRRIEMVAAVSKTGFTYVFERATGRPVWPIQEREVPQSDVPGERTSRTQPFPTKPPPFSKQGFTLDDVVDFTPELRAEALAVLKPYRFGPLFTPPSLQGTLTLPGDQGGANWGSAAFDPETSMLYVRSTNWPRISALAKPESGSEDIGYEAARVNMGTIANGIPIHKPPYGVVTGIDMNKGTLRWQVPAGDMPSVRNSPALRGLHLPPLGAVGHAGPMVTRGGLVFVCGDSRLLAYDKTDGTTLWQGDLSVLSDATPMTYQTRAGRQFVVVASGAGTDAALVAFTLAGPVPTLPH
jgi:quinoprotein glucose dehydrogenase